MGCCLGALLLAGAPRVALALWWFVDPSRIVGAFLAWPVRLAGITAPHWIWPALGLLLLPWTTIAFVFVAPGGLSTLDWIILVIALLLDLGAHGGGGRAYQRRYAH